MEEIKNLVDVFDVIAAEEHTTPEEVRKEIDLALLAAMHSANPAVRAAWEAVPCAGTIPSAEELIAWIATGLVA